MVKGPESRAASEPEPRAALYATDLDAVYREHVRFAWRLVANLGVRADDVADVVQEVFIVVHRRLDAVEIRCSVRAWIYGICVRCCANYRRRAVTRREQLFAEPPDSGTDERDRLNAKLDLQRALDLLDSQQRAVFLLYEVEGLAMAEVAQVLLMPASTAYSRLHAARETVQRELRKTHRKHHRQGNAPWTKNRFG